MEWTKLVITLIGSIGTILFGIFTWRYQRKKEFLNEMSKYVNPFLLSCEELQSRLYNMLYLNGLKALKERQPDGNYAYEIIFLIFQYFAWERIMLRYGPLFSRNPKYIDKTNEIRKLFGTATGDDTSKPWGTGPFYFPRHIQTAIGQSIITSNKYNNYNIDTITLFEFKELLDNNKFHNLIYIDQTIDELIRTYDIDELRGRERLKKIHKEFIDLILLMNNKLNYSFSTRDFNKDSNLK